MASTTVRLALVATFVPHAPRHQETQRRAARRVDLVWSAGYACTIDGYNATTMNNGWAARYYGSDTKGGIGTPPHNCTLFAAWMLAHNGLPDPGRTWGYANQWVFT